MTFLIPFTTHNKTTNYQIALAYKLIPIPVTSTRADHRVISPPYNRTILTTPRLKISYGNTKLPFAYCQANSSIGVTYFKCQWWRVVTFPVQRSWHGSGNPRLLQHGVWSCPLARQENASEALEAQCSRSFSWNASKQGNSLIYSITVRTESPLCDHTMHRRISASQMLPNTHSITPPMSVHVLHLDSNFRPLNAGSNKKLNQNAVSITS